MKTRHDLGPLDLHRCENKENIYEKSAKQAREGAVRKNVSHLVKKMKVWQDNKMRNELLPIF